MLSVYEGAYDARSRGLVRYVTSLMRLSWTQAELFENQLAHYLRGKETLVMVKVGAQGIVSPLYGFGRRARLLTYCIAAPRDVCW